jgi:hypothetical protein
MKHLKLFESFYYGSKELVDNLLSKWNVNPEDLEDLFIWFSDMGYTVAIRTNWFGHISDRTTAIKCIYVTISDIDDLYNEELNEEMTKVKKGLTGLGLHCEPPQKSDDIEMINFIIINRS